MTKLSLVTVRSLDAKVATPRYAREQLKPGIVHFGVGNFHRAHLAVYLDDLFNMGLDQDWAIIGAGVMPSDEMMPQKLAAQGLSHNNCRAGRQPQFCPHHRGDD